MAVSVIFTWLSENGEGMLSNKEARSCSQYSITKNILQITYNAKLITTDWITLDSIHVTEAGHN